MNKAMKIGLATIAVVGVAVADVIYQADYDNIGAQGVAAIYTGGKHGAWAALRRISIRARSRFNWIYPFNF